MSRSSAGFEPYPDAAGVRDYLCERFGMPAEALAEHAFWWRRGTRSIWILRAGHAPPAEAAVEAAGLVAFRQAPPRGFPTSAFLRRFGHAATRAVVDVDWPSALRLMHGEGLAEDGYPERGGPYILRSPRAVLGRGWTREGVLRLDVPKGWRKQLAALEELN